MTIRKNVDTLVVSDLMSAPVHSVALDERLADVHSLMRLVGIRHLAVVDGDGVLCGVISDRDVNLAWSQGADTPVRVFMTRNLQWVSPETTAREAAARMLQDRIGCLPVVDRQRRLLGIVTGTDFLLVAHRALTVQQMVAEAK
jgi:CBS domain-containing membrane protein